MKVLNWLFSAKVPECDKLRSAFLEQELAEARGEFHNTVQTVKSGTRRLQLMEEALALKEAYDVPNRR